MIPDDIHTQTSDLPGNDTQRPSHKLTRLFLWPGKALYVGQGVASDLHAHHAFQVGISRQQPLGVRLSQSLPYEATCFVAVKPQVSHQIDAHQRFCVFVWVEPESLLGQQLSRFIGDAPTRHGPSIADLLFPDTDLWQRAQELLIHPSEASAHALIDQVLPPGESPPIVRDPRIETLLALLQHAPLTTDVPELPVLANQVALSPSRLRHLFVEQVGISFQRYVLWRRLIGALLLSQQTGSLTTAAHQAGFADSAHLSRTVRATFGIKPSEIFGRSYLVQVHPFLRAYHETTK